MKKNRDGSQKPWRAEENLEGSIWRALTRKKANGYAFVGNWLRAGEREEMEVGSFILCYDETGPEVHIPSGTPVQGWRSENDLEEVFQVGKVVAANAPGRLRSGWDRCYPGRSTEAEPEEGSLLEQRLSSISDEGGIDSGTGAARIYRHKITPPPDEEPTATGRNPAFRPG